MAASVCSDCGKLATGACICCFPLPLLCEEHRPSHSADDHFRLPLGAFWCVRNEEAQHKLKDRLTKLRKQLFLIQLYSTSQQQPSLDVRDLLVQFYVEVLELISKTKELRAESAAELQEASSKSSIEGTSDALSCLVWSGNSPEGALGTLVCIGHGLSLKRDFQYEESCRELEARWKSVQSSEGVEVLVLGLALGEVMGLHIGRFQEALAVLELSIQAANRLQPASEVALQLANMKSATLIHLLNFEECLEFCTKVVPIFNEAAVSEVSYATVLYFFTISRTFASSKPQPEVKAAVQRWMAKTDTSDNNLIKLIRLCICAMLEMEERHYRRAEDLIKEAEELTKRDSPNSMYAGLSSFLRCIIENGVQQLHGATKLQEEECLKTHFPASLLRAVVLEANAKVYNRMGESAREVELRQLVHSLVQANPACTLFLSNIAVLEKKYLKRGQQQAAVDLRESAYHALSERYFASSEYIDCMKALSKLYEDTNQPQKKFELGAQALRRLLATHPTSEHLSDVLGSTIYFRGDSQKEAACEVCLETYNFLRANYPSSKNYSATVFILGHLFVNMNKEEKAAEIYLDGIQIAKTYERFDDYVEFIGSLLNLQSYRAVKERGLETRLEAHRFLVSKGSPACFNNAKKLIELYADQPDKELETWLEVYRVLQAHPSSPEFISCLESLSDYYTKLNQQEKVIELRLEGHKLLVACSNFFDNANKLASCYWAMNQRERALEFRLEVHRLLLAHPNDYNYQVSLSYLEDSCRQLQRLEVAVELFEEAYRLLLPEANMTFNWIAKELSNLYCKTGNSEKAIQLALKKVGNMALSTLEYVEDLHLLADLYVRASQTEAAVELYSKALQSSVDQHFYENSYNIMRYLFITLADSGEKERAVETCVEVICVLEQAGEGRVSEEAINLLLEFARDSKKEGIAVCRKALARFAPLCPSALRLAKVLYQAGRLHLSEDDFGQAEMCFQWGARVAMLSTPSTNEIGKQLRKLYCSKPRDD